MLLCGIILLIPVANLPPVSTTPVFNENLRKDVTTGVNDTGVVDSSRKFATSVVDADGVYLGLQISPRIFEKNS
jgi:hypothetical protein